jgi:hypothetical protein
LDHYLEIRGGTCGKVDSIGGTGTFIEGDVRLIGENNVDAIGAISTVKPDVFWSQRVCVENFRGHVTFLLLSRSGTPEPSGSRASTKIFQSKTRRIAGKDTKDRWSSAAAFACVVIAQEVAQGAFRSDIETDAVKPDGRELSTRATLEEHNRIIPSLVDYGRLSPIAYTEPLAAHEMPRAFHRIDLGRLRSFDMPPRLIEDEDGIRAWRASNDAQV